MPRLDEIEAFVREHGSCGALRSGLEDHEHGALVWMECSCSAMLARPVAAEDAADERGG